MSVNDKASRPEKDVTIGDLVSKETVCCVGWESETPK